MSEATRARAAALAASRGRSIGEVVDEALEALETAEFWRKTQEALRRRPVELDEDPVWELTVSSVSEARRGQIWLADFSVPVGHEQGKVRSALGRVRQLERARIDGHGPADHEDLARLPDQDRGLLPRVMSQDEGAGAGPGGPA